MSSIRQGGTLFEVVPALGKITSHGAGTARLMAVDSEQPGITLKEGLNRLGRDPSQNDHVIDNDTIRGVIGVFTAQPDAYSQNALNTMVQLGKVVAAALRDR